MDSLAADGGSSSASSTASKSSEEAKEASKDASPRERILAASLRLFVEKGYFNTNVPDISKLSRCSVGSIYHHFLNKEEIASQLYADGIQQFREAIAQAIDPDAELDSTIRHLVEAFLLFSEEHSELSRYIWLARHDEFLSQRVSRPTMVGFDKLGRKLTRLIKSAIRKGEIAPLKADIVWSIVFGIPLTFMTDWLEGHTSQSPSAAAPSISEAVASALKGPLQRS